MRKVQKKSSDQRFGVKLVLLTSFHVYFYIQTEKQTSVTPFSNKVKFFENWFLRERFQLKTDHFHTFRSRLKLTELKKLKARFI